eukprot:Filipodium_phascolosomae@DN8145_c0_g1_i1.p1
MKTARIHAVVFLVAIIVNVSSAVKGRGGVTEQRHTSNGGTTTTTKYDSGVTAGLPPVLDPHMAALLGNANLQGGDVTSHNRVITTTTTTTHNGAPGSNPFVGAAIPITTTTFLTPVIIPTTSHDIESEGHKSYIDSLHHDIAESKISTETHFLEALRAEGIPVGAAEERYVPYPQLKSWKEDVRAELTRILKAHEYRYKYQKGVVITTAIDQHEKYVKAQQEHLNSVLAQLEAAEKANVQTIEAHAATEAQHRRDQEIQQLEAALEAMQREHTDNLRKLREEADKNKANTEHQLDELHHHNVERATAAHRSAMNALQARRTMLLEDRKRLGEEFQLTLVKVEEEKKVKIEEIKLDMGKKIAAIKKEMVERLRLQLEAHTNDINNMNFASTTANKESALDHLQGEKDQMLEKMDQNQQAQKGTMTEALQRIQALGADHVSNYEAQHSKRVEEMTVENRRRLDEIQAAIDKIDQQMKEAEADHDRLMKKLSMDYVSDKARKITEMETHYAQSISQHQQQFLDQENDLKDRIAQAGRQDVTGRSAQVAAQTSHARTAAQTEKQKQIVLVSELVQEKEKEFQQVVRSELGLLERIHKNNLDAAKAASAKLEEMLQKYVEEHRVAFQKRQDSYGKFFEDAIQIM